MLESVQDLKQRVRETDLSVDTNQGVQQIIENELSKWLESYEDKKEMNMHDCYG